ALLVHGEQGVVDHVAVVAADVGGGPDRIDDLEVRVHDRAQRDLRAAVDRRRREGRQGGESYPEFAHRDSQVRLSPRRYGTSAGMLPPARDSAKPSIHSSRKVPRPPAPPTASL